MASDCTNNRYTHNDYIADKKAQEVKHKEEAYEKKVALWLRANPQVGSLNSGIFYVTGDQYPECQQSPWYKEVKVFSELN